MKHIAKALDFKFDKPEPFALEAETAIDHERKAQEEAKRELEMQEADNNQMQLEEQE